MLALTVAHDGQEFDQRTLQIHQAPNTKSDLLYKNALRERAKTIFSGLIVVDPDAQKTDAYQSNRNLMLSDEAEANSLPGLEIQANDVRCTHGATSPASTPSRSSTCSPAASPRRPPMNCSPSASSRTCSTGSPATNSTPPFAP
jgi:Fe-S cluster assembly protein SufD